MNGIVAESNAYPIEYFKKHHNYLIAGTLQALDSYFKSWPTIKFCCVYLPTCCCCCNFCCCYCCNLKCCHNYCQSEEKVVVATGNAK